MTTTENTTDRHPFVLKLATVSPVLADLIEGRMSHGYTLEEVQRDIANAIGAAEAEAEDPTRFAVSAKAYLTPKEIGYLLCGCFEGNFMTMNWLHTADHEGWVRPEGFDLPWYADEDWIGSPGFSFTVQYDNPDSDDQGSKTISRTDVTGGLSTMAADYPIHWADLIHPDGNRADAITYDVAMQCIVLGSVVYG